MADDVDIQVADDPPRVVAERLVAVAREGGSIVLTGGSSPRRAYELAAAMLPDWSSAELWWGDERCVPPDDDRSNFGMAKTSLLDHVETAAVHRIEGELGPGEAARRYDSALAHVDRFDLVLLGVGPDGHVASLFPDAPTLDETERRAVGADAHFEPFVDRVTLTLPMLRRARAIVFLVTGDSKADAVRRAFAAKPSRATPSSLVRADGGTTTVVLDSAAASRL